MIHMQTELSEQLVRLLRDAGSTHHKAFAATNGDNPEWPIWYAEFLQPKLNSLMSTKWTKVRLCTFSSGRKRSALP